MVRYHLSKFQGVFDREVFVVSCFNERPHFRAAFVVRKVRKKY